MVNTFKQKWTATLSLALAILIGIEVSARAKEDLIFDGVYEAAMDLPRIQFVLKRQLSGPPLAKNEDSELEYAFLDTGTSGIVFSRETVESMAIALHPAAKFVEIGVGGKEYFKVSEPLYIGLKSLESQNQNSYTFFGPWRFEVKPAEAGMLEGPLDVVGMPAMVDHIIVLNSAATNSMSYFTADIKKAGDPQVPAVDIATGLRFKNFSNKDPENIPPMPVEADNLLIDGITVACNGKVSKGNWLFDTGATVSFISTRQARVLGLMDANNTLLVKQAFSVPVGGVGNISEMPGFQVDSLKIPCIGRNLIFKNARLGVKDIQYIDENGKKAVIDGVFGSNFLCASAKMEGMLPSQIGQTPFSSIVIDLQKKTLGFAIRKNHEPADVDIFDILNK